MVICFTFLNILIEWPRAVKDWLLSCGEIWTQSWREYPLGSHEYHDLIEHIEVLLEQGRVQGNWLPVIARPVKRIKYYKGLYIIFHHDVNPVLIIFIWEIHEHILFACLPIYEWPLSHSNSNGLLFDLIPFRVELAKPDHQLFHP